jgi:hypothetical protein
MNGINEKLEKDSKFILFINNVGYTDLENRVNSLINPTKVKFSFKISPRFLTFGTILVDNSG